MTRLVQAANDARVAIEHWQRFTHVHLRNGGLLWPPKPEAERRLLDRADRSE